MELVISIAATVISVFSLSWSIRTSIKQREDSALAANLLSLSQVEATLGERPRAFRFHGITPKEIEDTGLTPEEFIYLLNNFTLGRLSYYTSWKGKAIIKPNTYRYAMCQSEDTRRCWPVLRRMLEPSSYRDALDRVFAELDRVSPLGEMSPVILRANLQMNKNLKR